jgi:hypothetical protein
MMVSQREGRSVCKELPRCFTRTKRTGSHNESLHGIWNLFQPRQLENKLFR